MEYITRSAAETERLGARLARVLEPGDVILTVNGQDMMDASLDTFLAAVSPLPTA